MAEIPGLHPKASLTAEARLVAIVDSSFDAIVGKDLDSIITDWNPAAQRMFGYTAEEAIGQSVLMLIPDGLRSEEIDIIERIKRGEPVTSFDTVRQRKDGTLVFVSLTISPIKDSAGRIVGASKIARDITEKRENERRIRTLLREVNHRVKNQFAVILSVIRETANRTADKDEFIEHVRERITGLSRSHDLLVSSDWSGASLFELVQEHLRPFGHEERVTLSGPLVMLTPNAVQYLGMAIHELGTNAAKYGALTDTTGLISIAWQVVKRGEQGDEFHLVWEETSVPRQTEADMARRGFGNVVLQRIAPQSMSGTSAITREPGHIRWELQAPAATVLVQPATADEYAGSRVP
ncbi:MAG: PAS domain S-box protein [Mesorhizobium sp.]|nr:PAS domain S-box protein [Mesorhizobium sp.]MBN9243445.1 PAS domain S-box protein [Mesorhizobium sp.]